MKAYIASPFGFSECGRKWMYEEFIPAIENCGLKIIDPWKLTSDDEVQGVLAIADETERLKALKELNTRIGTRNAEGIQQADAVIAVLDGVDVDSGTASEIGYAAALGKWVIGYRGDFRMAGDNPGAVVNLQVEYFIHRSEGPIVHSLDDLVQALKELRRN